MSAGAEDSSLDITFRVRHEDDTTSTVRIRLPSWSAVPRATVAIENAELADCQAPGTVESITWTL